MLILQGGEFYITVGFPGTLITIPECSTSVIVRYINMSFNISVLQQILMYKEWMLTYLINLLIEWDEREFHWYGLVVRVRKNLYTCAKSNKVLKLKDKSNNSLNIRHQVFYARWKCNPNFCHKQTWEVYCVYCWSSYKNLANPSWKKNIQISDYIIMELK